MVVQVVNRVPALSLPGMYVVLFSFSNLGTARWMGGSVGFFFASLVSCSISLSFKLRV